MVKKMNVAVTAAGSTNAISVIKALRCQSEFDVAIVGLDLNRRTHIAGSAFCDAFETVPPVAEEPAYIEAVLGITWEWKIDLLIPILDAELDVLARHRNRFDPRCCLLVSPHETIACCNDKEATIRFFLDNGIPTLPTVAVPDGTPVAGLLEEKGLRYPLIAKPRRGHGGRDVHVIMCEEDLVLLRRVHDPLLQQMADGLEYSIDIFCEEGGRLRAAVPRVRLELRAGICYKGRTERDPAMVDQARRIAEGLRILGPANIQCFRSADDVRFTEVNPRFSAGLPLTVAAGVNTPLMALRLAAGRSVGAAMEFEIVTMCRYWQEVFYHEY